MAAVIDRQQVAAHSTGAALGADVEGVDLAGALAPEAIAAVKAARAQHLVLRFRGRAAATNDAPEGREYIMVGSNVIENGQAIGQLGAYEAIWHPDMSYVQEPPSASALYALEVPPEGGDTGFCNMYRAYETLPDGLRRESAGPLCRHDA